MCSLVCVRQYHSKRAYIRPVVTSLCVATSCPDLLTIPAMTIPGQRTLLESLRETAARNPEAVAIHQIALNGEKETNYLLTYVDLVKRIDELSWWLSKQIAKKVDQKSRPKTIAFVTSYCTQRSILIRHTKISSPKRLADLADSSSCG